jgi:hypothetical protein
LSLRFGTLFGRTVVLLCWLACFQMPLYAETSGGGTVTKNKLDTDVREFRMEELAASLQKMLPGPERDYFAGVLANRTGHVDESIRLLNNALPKIRASHRDRAAAALEILADNYNKTFRYSDAATAYDDLLTHFSDQLRGDHLQGTKDDAGVVHLLREAPAQTVTWSGPTRLKTERDAIGSLVTELAVKGVREKWLLDTGANISAVSRSFAEKLGLQPLPGFGQTMSGLTGIENPLQVAIVPVLQMGGATLRNVVVLILDDDNLKIKLPNRSYQINGIIGYPVFQALGVVTFFHNGLLEAGPGTDPNISETHMYMKFLQPVIECRIQGQSLPFPFDSGADGTFLSIRYYKQFQDDSRNWKKGENIMGGGGGAVRRKVYLIPQLHLQVGTQIATLHNVPVFPTPIGADRDELYGNLGQDFVSGFEDFTLDFSKMTFGLGAPLANQTKH